MTSAHIRQFSWENAETPQFEYGENGEKVFHAVKFGETLSVRIISGPQCIGYQRGGVWYPCPHAHTGMRKCEDCKQKEGLSIEQFCDGYNTDLFTPADVERLQVPHYVYLALFKKDMYKVGVSGEARGFLRQLEQGTHFALILARGLNGLLARQMETALRRFGIPDKMLISQKKDFIFPDLDEAAGKKILEDLREKYLPELLYDRPDLKKYVLDPPEFKNFAPVYHLETALASPKPIHDVTLAIGDVLSGIVLAVKGSFLVLETDREKILLNAKELSGFLVDFQPEPLGFFSTQAFQGALF